MAKQNSEAAFVVAQPFRDKDDFNKEHKVGDDVSHFDEQRLSTLLGLGLIEQKPADNAGTGTAPAGNAGKQSSKKAGTDKADNAKPADNAGTGTAPADDKGTGEVANGTDGSNPLLD